MIERVLIKNHLGFKHVALEFSKGLIVITGPSGAGKSVFMQGLLSVFGHAEVMAEGIECSLDDVLDLDSFGFMHEEEGVTVFKALKSKSVRYFINDQSASKKSVLDVSKTFLNYLSAKDANEFDRTRLIALLDGVCASHEPSHKDNVEAFKEEFQAYQGLKQALDHIEAEEKKVEELKEFTRFEIAKIEEIAPKIGEDETLIAFKKSLSKKEKTEQALKQATAIFTLESRVHEALALMEHRSDFFDEAMNELRVVFEKEQERLSELEDIDVEAMLDRIEKIASLKKRYGSIEDILSHLQKRKEELLRYENIAFEKQTLQKNVQTKAKEIAQKSEDISATRRRYLEPLAKVLNAYLKELYMPYIELGISQGVIDELGSDVVDINLGKVDLRKISSGEYNRLRLAFLATYNAFMLTKGGILILDEIDANLSGKESMSVAKVLKELSKMYQIFAISHQPQLSACANQHYLVTKDDENQSHIRALDVKERQFELARMVSGENISDEALQFANALLESNYL